MAESNDYWQMLAEQERGLSLYDTEDANGAGGWQGDVFRSGEDAQSFLNYGGDVGVLGDFINTSSDNQVYMDGLSARDTAVGQPGELTVDGMIADQGGYLDGNMGQQSGGGIVDTLSKGAVTVDNFFKSFLGAEGAQKLYASAIAAGVNAILQSNNTESANKFRNEDREDRQAHEDEMLAEKYKREDEARARKNAVPGAGGRFNYKPQATKNYQVPGATQTYGFLGGK
jgi:hypothetical protein